MIIAGRKVVDRELSVRATEELVRRLNKGASKDKDGQRKVVDKFSQKVESDLRSRYGKKVKLFRSSRGGRIIIPFENDEQLKQIYDDII